MWQFDDDLAGAVTALQQRFHVEAFYGNNMFGMTDGKILDPPAIIDGHDMPKKSLTGIAPWCVT